jgi:para-nitrobenzyl esterase
MKQKLTLAILPVLIYVNVFAQVACGGGRYYDDVFQNVGLTTGVVYGHNTDVNGTLQTLKLDIYTPATDTVTKRPLIIFAFGGSFVFGLRTSPDIVQLCNAFAKKGYVCASIDYRLGLSPGGLNVTAANVRKAILRATHDMRAAVRFMRMEADTFGIDTARIIVGGVSAGGFAALHCAYMDELSEVTSLIDTTGEGGVEGNSGNPGYSSRPWAVVNLCGALLDTTWMHAGDPAVVTMQGNHDGSVPYCTDVEKVLGTPIAGLLVAGGNPVERRAWNLGLATGFYTWWGADHTPFILGTNTVAYMDTTIKYIRDFLSNQLCATSFTYTRDALTENACNTVSSVEELADRNITVFPNPSKGNITIRTPEASMWSMEMFDAAGRIVLSQKEMTDKFGVNTTQMSAGVYLLRITGKDFSKTAKILVEE